MNWPIFLKWMKNSTNILVRLLAVIMKTELSYSKNPKMCDPILVTPLKMQPHYSQSSRENATPSSGTSPVASYKQVPPGVYFSSKIYSNSFFYSYQWDRRGDPFAARRTNNMLYVTVIVC